MKAKIRYFALALYAAVCTAAYGAEPVFHHTFSTTADESGKYKGTLRNGAVLTEVNGVKVLSLGTSGGYFDFGSSLGELIGSLSGDYSISTNLFVPESTSLGANGNFVYCFNHSSSEGYLFFGANSSRYSITLTNWGGEQTVNANTALPRGRWLSLSVVQSGDKATIYIDGKQMAQADITLHPATLGATANNWLGKSPYNGDVDLKDASYADFRIYNVALTGAEVAELAADPDLSKLNADIFVSQIEAAVEACAFDFSALRSNVVLPAALGSGVTATWVSSDKALVTDAGIVTRPAAGKPDGKLTLTLTASKGGASKVFEYPATVCALLADEEAVQHDLDNIELAGNISNLRSDLVLPSSTPEGSILTWKSSDKVYITDGGKLLRVAPAGKGKHKVTLTATATRGEASATRDFEVSVAEDEGYDSYLFAFFPSNSDENLYYAIGSDGFNYTVINNEKRILNSADYAIKKGIRDPHIIRGEDGMFYMVATDMRSAEGWSSNRGMVLSKSPDLVNWTHATVHFPDRFPAWKNVTRVWAPEIIWDAKVGKYLIYYSLLTNDGKVPYDKVFYSYANADFTDLETEPEYFYDRGSATIDCDIIFDEREQLYHMVFKNEGSGGICQVTAKTLTPEPGMPAGSQWSAPSSTLQQTTLAVEGAGMFRLINSDTWVLMYDCYMNGFYQFCTTDDLYNFTLRAQTATKGAFTPRHGVVLPITAAEKERLLTAFPIGKTECEISGAADVNVRTGNVAIKGSDIFVPVRPGTDLSAFDPHFIVSAGAKVSPEGEQDFTAGAVSYTVTNGSASATYSVTAGVQANPVLPGFTADPEVMYSHKTGRFYIYPTTDGIASWGGHTFNAYSSTDLVNWQKEACILDLATDAVPWATGNAWAPCIEEKYENGAYRYYFYFSGHNPDVNYKTLGCAVSDSPTGPFYDLGEPLVKTNITSGQLIDSDVFTDDDGSTYFYWGNGNLVASKLGADMRTISEPTVITPQGGTNGTYAFREGVYVFKRNGIYYFLWSVDDTGARNYHVAYGTATSPMGPITVAEQPIVLQQKASEAIYGTGHNSVICNPGTDDWYIVYHRINKAYINSSPGVHREVCIDRLFFNPDGTIVPVEPTHRGIDPLTVGKESGIEDVVAPSASEVVAVRYYTLAGIAVAAPSARGLYIKVEILADGTTRSVKTLVR